MLARVAYGVPTTSLVMSLANFKALTSPRDKSRNARSRMGSSREWLGRHKEEPDSNRREEDGQDDVEDTPKECGFWR